MLITRFIPSHATDKIKFLRIPEPTLYKHDYEPLHFLCGAIGKSIKLQDKWASVDITLTTDEFYELFDDVTLNYFKGTTVPNNLIQLILTTRHGHFNIFPRNIEYTSSEFNAIYRIKFDILEQLIFK